MIKPLLGPGCALAVVLCAQGRSAAVTPDYSWLNQTAGPRPTYVWENREDTIYHEMWYADTNKAERCSTILKQKTPLMFRT